MPRTDTATTADDSLLLLLLLLPPNATATATATLTASTTHITNNTNAYTATPIAAASTTASLPLILPPPLPSRLPELRRPPTAEINRRRTDPYRAVAGLLSRHILLRLRPRRPSRLRERLVPSRHGRKGEGGGSGSGC